MFDGVIFVIYVTFVKDLCIDVIYTSKYFFNLYQKCIELFVKQKEKEIKYYELNLIFATLFNLFNDM